MLQMSGGLGNQMFLYAIYLALKDMGRKVCIDDYTMYEAIGRKDDCLERIFNLSYLHAERDEYIRLTDSSLTFKDRVRRKLTGRRGKLYTEKDAITYEEGIFEVLDAYCIGYWQSERYFERVKEQVREQFRFRWNQFSERTREYKKRIETCNAISIHVRRGDYLNEKFAPIYGGI